MCSRRGVGTPVAPSFKWCLFEGDLAMKKIIPLTLLVVVFGGLVAADAQPFPERVPYIAGRWFMKGDEFQPCEIRQRGSRALFINEHGDAARGTVGRDHVFLPDWSDGRGSDGLFGRIRGDRIV